MVYGYFALTFVTPLLQQFLPGLSGFNALSPGLVMGLMILPLVSSLSEDAMRAVPNGLREGSYALGASRMQTALKVVVPAAFSGITAAFILALARYCLKISSPSRGSIRGDAIPSCQRTMTASRAGHLGDTRRAPSRPHHLASACCCSS